jgi:NAD(P) transhydrogenase
MIGTLDTDKTSEHNFDLLVIGSGPAGHHGAIEAAKMGKRVGIIDKTADLGGVCLHTGTIPSKTLREAVLYLSGFRQRSFYGRGYRVKARIHVQDLMFRVNEVIKRQYAVIEDQLQRHGVQVIDGHAQFTGDPHTLQVTSASAVREFTAEKILIACGTRPARREDIQFEALQIFDTDEFIQVTQGEFPKSVIVVGGGVIGLEYASMAAALGSEVTIVEARDTLLSYVDAEITQSLMYQLRRAGVTFRLGEKVVSVEALDTTPLTAVAHLESGKRLIAQALLYAVGRQPNTDKLNLGAVGIETVERGQLAVNEFFQTPVANIYAAGDVVGFPSLASTSMEQGRQAVGHMFGEAGTHRPDLLPYGIYTIPEISMVGKNEMQLTHDKVPYEVGVAQFDEVAKAQITGDQTGLLKLIFHAETLQLLGVHIVGDNASELVHIGQMVMMTGGSVEMLSKTVFNYPSLAEAYRVAAVNGLDKLRRRGSGSGNPATGCAGSTSGGQGSADAGVRAGGSAAVRVPVLLADCGALSADSRRGADPVAVEPGLGPGLRVFAGERGVDFDAKRESDGTRFLMVRRGGSVVDRGAAVGVRLVGVTTAGVAGNGGYGAIGAAVELRTSGGVGVIGEGAGDRSAGVRARVDRVFMKS